MTDKTFTVTIDQIKEIYHAGIRRGQEEQGASDWGCRPQGSKYFELVYEFHDIVNKDRHWMDDDYVKYEVIEQWFKDAK